MRISFLKKGEGGSARIFAFIVSFMLVGIPFGFVGLDSFQNYYQRSPLESGAVAPADFDP